MFILWWASFESSFLVVFAMLGVWWGYFSVFSCRLYRCCRGAEGGCRLGVAAGSSPILIYSAGKALRFYGVHQCGHLCCSVAGWTCSIICGKYRWWPLIVCVLMFRDSYIIMVCVNYQLDQLNTNLTFPPMSIAIPSTTAIGPQLSEQISNHQYTVTELPFLVGLAGECNALFTGNLLRVHFPFNHWLPL